MNIINFLKNPYFFISPSWHVIGCGFDDNAVNFQLRKKCGIHVSEDGPFTSPLCPILADLPFLPVKLNISFDFYRVCENTYKSWVRFFSESGTTMTWDIHALAHHVVISDFMDCNFKKSTGFSGRAVHHEMKPGGERIFEKLRWNRLLLHFVL